MEREWPWQEKEEPDPAEDREAGLKGEGDDDVPGDPADIAEAIKGEGDEGLPG